MREIKYRAFIKSLQVMAPVAAIHFDIKTVEVDMSDEADPWEYDFDEVELMQWTGLVDRNGVDIYEGDVIFFKKSTGRNYKSVVEFLDGGFGDDIHHISGMREIEVAYSKYNKMEVAE